MKICTKCGAMQDDGAVFCNKCGGSFNNAIIPPQQQSQQPQQQYQQQYQQPQQFQQQYQPQFQPQYAAAGVPVGAAVSKGSKKKLIIIISAIVAVIGITLLILFLFVFKSKKDLIVGTWQEDGKNGNVSYTRFYDDGTVDLDVGKDKKAKYKIDGDELIITRDSISQSYTIVELTSDKLILKQTYDGETEEVTFKKVDDNEPENNRYKTKAALKTANANAKLIFTTCNNKASDMIADNLDVDKLEYSGPVSGLSGPLGNAVKEALKDNGADSGYVYIYFDPTLDYDATDSQNFAQWSATESGSVIGQFPNAPKSVDESLSISFGTYKK